MKTLISTFIKFSIVLLLIHVFVSKANGQKSISYESVGTDLENISFYISAINQSPEQEFNAAELKEFDFDWNEFNAREINQAIQEAKDWTSQQALEAVKPAKCNDKN